MDSGPSALVGVGTMALFSPLISLLVKQQHNTRNAQLRIMDARMTLMSKSCQASLGTCLYTKCLIYPADEILVAIRSIKLYAYINSVLETVFEFRRQEAHSLKFNLLYRVCAIGLL